MPRDEGSVLSADGTSIGFVTEGAGPPLLIVHGGMRSSNGWEPLLAALAPERTVTALDRRGRGRSPDAGSAYSLATEAADIAAVASMLADEHGGPVDAFGHSYGALVLLAAAAAGAPLRRLAVYEPPGPETLPPEVERRITRHISDGEVGRAVVVFLTEIVGMPREQILAMRDSPVAAESVAIAESTFVREAGAITAMDIPALAPAVTQPVLLILGENSPGWARIVTDQLDESLPVSRRVVLPGQGHEAVDSAPATVGRLLVTWFDSRLPAPES